MVHAPWGNEGVDPPEVPMQHARRDSGQGTLGQLVAGIVIAIAVIVILGTLFTGQWVAFWISLGVAVIIMLAFLVKIGCDQFIESSK